MTKCNKIHIDYSTFYTSTSLQKDILTPWKSELVMASALFRVPRLTELAIKASQSISGSDRHWMKAFQSFPYMGWSPDLCTIPTLRCNLLFYTSNNGRIHTGPWQPVCFTVMAVNTWHLIRRNLTANNTGLPNIKAQKWFQLPFILVENMPLKDSTLLLFTLLF